jgi:lysophospholipase L1-like esterase
MKRHLSVAAVVLATALVLVARPEPAAAAARAYALGDSVMLGARTELTQRDIRVDAAVSRQFPDGTAILASRRSQGLLPKVVVVHLGSNGPITRAQFDSLMKTLKGKQVIVLTVELPRTWKDSVNSVLRAGAQRWKNAELLDWSWHATRHPDWLYADGTHLRPAGAAAYAKLVSKAVKTAAAR